MCGGALGSGGAGASPFGSGSILGIESAFQSAMNAVAPRMRDPGDVRDALRAAGWSLSVVGPLPIVARLVQAVERVDAVFRDVWARNQ